MEGEAALAELKSLRDTPGFPSTESRKGLRLVRSLKRVLFEVQALTEDAKSLKEMPNYFDE